MNIVTCPNCRVSVMTTAEGQCPSCRHFIAGPSSRFAPSVTSKPPIVVEPPELRIPSDFADVSNPYQPPQMAVDENTRRGPSDAAVNSGLIWALFMFSGRIPRRTFWGSMLVVGAFYFGSIAAVVALLDVAFGDIGHTSEFDDGIMGVSFFSVWAVCAWTFLAVQAKRWHDLDKSGWWFLIYFIPVFGPITLFIQLGCLRGTYGVNRYGPDPTESLR